MADEDKLEQGAAGKPENALRNGEAEDFLAQLAADSAPAPGEVSAEREEPLANPELEEFFRGLAKDLEKPDPGDGEALLYPAPRPSPEIPAAGPPSVAAPATQGATAAAPVLDVVRCSKCGHKNPAPNRFCGSCGSELSRTPAPNKPKEIPRNNRTLTTLGLETAGATPARMAKVEQGSRESQRGYWFLALLLVLLGVLGFQQWQLWKMQRFLPGWQGPGGAENSIPSAPSAQSATGPAAPLSPAQPSANPSPPHPSAVKKAEPGMAGPASVPSPRPRISADAAQARLVHEVAPEYPSIAREAHVGGAVTLQATIGKDGTIQRLKAVNGNPLLLRAALDAVKQWRYRPYNVKGQSVEVDTTITVNFPSRE